MNYQAATNAGGVIQARLADRKVGPCKVSAADYYAVITKEEAVTLPPLSAALRQHTDGYRLYADGSSIIMQAASPRGILYAWQEWKRRGHIAAGFFKEEVPSRSFRAIHIDLRYGFWHRERLKEIIDTLIELRYNTLILETENRLPLTRHPDIVAPEHFTPEDLAWLSAYAKERFLELIPLQQTLGHLEYALKLPQYAHLREVREQPEKEPLFYPGNTGANHYHDFDEICPCRPGAYELVEDLLDETMAFFPESRYIHIGSDEAWNLLYCDDCKARYGDKSKLLIAHINRIAGRVLEAGRIPIMWDDMLRHMGEEELAQLDQRIVLMPWLYMSSHPQADTFIPAYERAGFTVLGAGSAKCSLGTPETLDVPDYEGRFANIDWWDSACDRYGLSGYSVTVWSNYSGTIAPPHPQFDTAWLSIAYGAQKLWNASVSAAQFKQQFAARFFGVDVPLGATSLSALLPVVKQVEEGATRHTYEARLWYLGVVSGLYRLKSQFVARELYRYHLPITDAERGLLDRRLAEITRLRQWLKPRLQEALQQSYSERETAEFLAARFEADEALYRAYI